MRDTFLLCPRSTSFLLSRRSSCCSSKDDVENEFSSESMNIDGALEPRRMYLRLEVGDCRRLSEGTFRVATCPEAPGLNFIDKDTRLGTCFGSGDGVLDDGLETAMVRLVT